MLPKCDDASEGVESCTTGVAVVDDRIKTVF